MGGVEGSVRLCGFTGVPGLRDRVTARVLYHSGALAKALCGRPLCVGGVSGWSRGACGCAVLQGFLACGTGLQLVYCTTAALAELPMAARCAGEVDF